ncbi:MAG TPA: prepilin-type N-terminal cleavage/methylation domain-containing protein [Coleofasciculaceae cyanobacterium]
MSVSTARFQQWLHNLGQTIAKTQGGDRCHPPSAQGDPAGVTLIECLIAILVIGLTVSLITPPIFIAVATRAQSRRAEQALQIAQGEVDRIRVMVARGNHTIANLPKPITNTDLQAYPPPRSFFSNTIVKTPNGGCTGGIVRYDDQPIDADKALKVDVDGDCQADFFMQVFRTNTPADQLSNQSKPSNFQLGVRVYAIMADGNQAGNSWGNLQTDPASLKLTNGEGGQRKQPLAVIYTPFSWSDQSSSLCDYQPSGALPGSCPARP